MSATVSTVVSSARFTVDEIELSISNIATSTKVGERGNNEHALELASFQDKKLTFTRGTESFNLTLADMYRADVSTVAVKTKKSIEFAEFEESIMQQLENFRESVSGVSIDSELTNMMAFQKAFEASARVVRVIDNLTDSVISLVG